MAGTQEDDVRSQGNFFYKELANEEGDLAAAAAAETAAAAAAAAAAGGGGGAQF